jgi:hypothetical protein
MHNSGGFSPGRRPNNFFTLLCRRMSRLSTRDTSLEKSSQNAEQKLDASLALWL